MLMNVFYHFSATTLFKGCSIVPKKITTIKYVYVLIVCKCINAHGHAWTWSCIHTFVKYNGLFTSCTCSLVNIIIRIDSPEYISRIFMFL